MTAQSSPDLQKARQLASTAHVLAVVTLVSLGVYIAGRIGPSIGNALFNEATPWRQEIHHIGLLLIAVLPAVLFFEAINQLRHALQCYRAGEFFSSSAASHVAKAGDHAITATIAAIVVVPTLTLWVSGHGGADVRIEPELIGMLTLALFVSAVGRILATAYQLKAENDSFV